VIIAVVAMLLPGTDPVTMLIAMAPLVVLYELSILLATMLGRAGGPQEIVDDSADDLLS
jgi:sec-independent protein translocase protein TatC